MGIKWGDFDKTGKIVIPIQYGNTAVTESGDYASDFKDEYVQVYDIKNKRTKYIDKTGKEFSFNFDDYMGQNLYLQKTKDDNYIIIDNIGKHDESYPRRKHKFFLENQNSPKMPNSMCYNSISENMSSTRK